MLHILTPGSRMFIRVAKPGPDLFARIDCAADGKITVTEAKTLEEIER